MVGGGAESASSLESIVSCGCRPSAKPPSRSEAVTFICVCVCERESVQTWKGDPVGKHWKESLSFFCLSLIDHFSPPMGENVPLLCPCMRAHAHGNRRGRDDMEDQTGRPDETGRPDRQAPAGKTPEKLAGHSKIRPALAPGHDP